jgi:hypothetical protein
MTFDMQNNYSYIKTITVDGFYSAQAAQDLSRSVYYLQRVDTEFGLIVPDFELIPPDADQLFSSVFQRNLVCSTESGSGGFLIPKTFVHFESFASQHSWCFAVALQESTFNIYEHNSGAKDARQNHRHNYQNLFDWNCVSSHNLQPGSGVLFRPWLFHSFDTGLIQKFRLTEIPNHA